jgi:hypothetical protein
MIRTKSRLAKSASLKKKNCLSIAQFFIDDHQNRETRSKQRKTVHSGWDKDKKTKNEKEGYGSATAPSALESVSAGSGVTAAAGAPEAGSPIMARKSSSPSAKAEGGGPLSPTGAAAATAASRAVEAGTVAAAAVSSPPSDAMDDEAGGCIESKIDAAGAVVDADFAGCFETGAAAGLFEDFDPFDLRLGTATSMSPDSPVIGSAAEAVGAGANEEEEAGEAADRLTFGAFTPAETPTDEPPPPIPRISPGGRDAGPEADDVA